MTSEAKEQCRCACIQLMSSRVQLIQLIQLIDEQSPIQVRNLPESFFSDQVAEDEDDKEAQEKEKRR